MTNKELIAHLLDELNVINWLVVLACCLSISFAGGTQARDFLKTVALASLPTSVNLRNKKR